MTNVATMAEAGWARGYGHDLSDGKRNFCHECLWVKPVSHFSRVEDSHNGYCLYCTDCLWRVFNTTRPDQCFSNAQPDQYTYVVVAPAVKMVKIGKAKNPEDRLGTMQTGSPVRLDLLEITADIPETKFHKDECLREHHSHGEWYYLSSGFVEAFEQIVACNACDCNLANIDWDDVL